MGDVLNARLTEFPGELVTDEVTACWSYQFQLRRFARYQVQVPVPGYQVPVPGYQVPVPGYQVQVLVPGYEVQVPVNFLLFIVQLVCNSL